MKRILWWLRRDVRLNDTVVLHHALNDADAVLPIFILDPTLLASKKLAPARRQFLFDALAELDANLRKRGAYLIVRQGDAARELVCLARETQADAVYFHADYTPYARRRDARVCTALDAAGIHHRTFNDLYLADPHQVVQDNGNPYTVYSRYRARWASVVSIPPRYETKRSLSTPPKIPSLELNAWRTERNPQFARGGERAGTELARAFTAHQNGLHAYGESRDDLAADATSHLSPHLHFGTVSVRELARLARENLPARSAPRQAKRRETRAAAQVWLDELVWREFFNHVMYHFPHAARESFRANYAALKWESNPAQFAAWSEGRTGFPLVDAGMRQLNATGWMHNRARMVTASFLTKDLLMDWRAGERYFLQHLIDGDIASNNGGWQWTAGTGTDAQPYFRIFNPVLQSMRFDPGGSYIRRWVPELANVPNEYLHAPWTLPVELAHRLHFELGQDYPKPLVDHAAQRVQALQLYRRAQIHSAFDAARGPELQTEWEMME